MNQLTEQLYYRKHADFWEEALPVGNGMLGGMIFGNLQQEKISLNEGTLWSGIPHSGCNKNFKTLVEQAGLLIAERRFSAATELIDNKLSDVDSASFLPAGDCHILFKNSTPTNIRKLSLETAETSASNGDLTETIFASYPERLIVAEFSGAMEHCRLQLTSPWEGEMAYHGEDLIFTGDAPYRNRNGETILQDKSGARGVKFQIRCRVKTDGILSFSQDFLTISQGSFIQLRIAIRTNFVNFMTDPNRNDAPSPEELTLDDLERAEKFSFEELRRRHRTDYQNLYLRSRLDLPEFQEDYHPTDKRLHDAFMAESFSPSLAALLYHYGRYLLISSSRQGGQAANLQGIWNHLTMPPWGSNYTTNINTQMNYWPAENCALPECGEALFSMIKDLAVSGSFTARQWYGLPGWCCHHNTDLWRFSYPAAGLAQWSYFPLAGVWLCRHLFEHLEYHEDPAFKKEYWEVFSGAAEFVIGLLVEDENGTLTIVPSTSPENSFIDPADGRISSVSSGSVMNLAIIKELFENIIRFYPEEALSKKIRTILPRLAKYKISKAGHLLEFGGEFEETDIHHRHLSHLYGVFPGNDFFKAENKNYLDAARKSLLRRGDESTGWAMGWRVALWARLQDGEHANRVIKRFLTPVSPATKENYHNGGIYPNLFDAHPPFQIDGNFDAHALKFAIES